jgi:hypothetical protein
MLTPDSAAQGTALSRRGLVGPRTRPVLAGLLRDQAGSKCECKIIEADDPARGDPDRKTADRAVDVLRGSVSGTGFDWDRVRVSASA